MSTLVGLPESRSGWEPPLSGPLDEAVWQTWMEKGREQDNRSSAARVKAVKWVSIAALLAAAGLWSYLTPYDIVVRFVVAAGASVLMFQAFHTRHYALAPTFGALAMVFNPVVPVFGFSGDWQRAVLVTSTVPFVASLGWRRVRRAHND